MALTVTSGGSGQLFGGATNVVQKAAPVPQSSSFPANFTQTANPQTAPLTFSSPAAVTSAPAPAPTFVAPQPPPDPYAGTVFGSTANHDRIQNDWNSQRDTTMSSINDRIGNDANTYHSSIIDYIESLKNGQGKIDQSAVQNELARQQGQTGVIGTVGRGLRSGGIVLANKNAGTSSATEALARAYSDIGQREMSGVDNQYENGKYKIGLDQADLDAQAATGARHINDNKNNVINTIVSDAQSAIAALNASASTASLTDRVDIEAKKAEIRNQAMAKLQAYDGELAGAKPAAASVETNRGQANQLAQAGNAAANPFQYSTEIPTQFQSSGPFASDIPLFSLTGTKNKNQNG